MDLNQLRNLIIHPVLGLEYSKNDFMPLDLSIKNGNIRGIDVVEGLDRYIKAKLAAANKKIAIGGYGEERDFYWTSPLFISSAEKRTIHLGTDLWTDALCPIYTPLDATVYGVNYNNMPLDYGYTVVLKHSMEDNTFYTLYGHLSDIEINKLTVGQRIEQGSIFCYVGTSETNGGWAPHLHLQLILDMENNIHDYPGVSTRSAQDHYLRNCPDPEILIFK